MADITGVPHVRMEEEEEHDFEGDSHAVQMGDMATDSSIRTPPSERSGAPPPLSMIMGNSPHITAVVTPHVRRLNGPSVRGRRTKILTVFVSALALVGVSVACTRMYYTRSASSENTNVEAASFEGDIGTGSDAGMVATATLDISELDLSSSESGSSGPDFLKLQQRLDGGSSVFQLSKATWNSSFVVYPTVARHSAPQIVGLERGSILLETSDNVFHFELPSDGSNFLILVQDYVYGRLGEASEELRAMFEDSQWPGHVAKVPIYMETDESYFIPSDPFFSNGFYVSSILALASDYSPLATASASYPRNSMFQVEYETMLYGVLLVNYAIGLLPEKIMPQRVADDRVGFFGIQYTRYGMTETDKANGNNIGFHNYNPQVRIVKRRRLEIDSETGSVKEPIKYYIDPSVPERWRAAFAAGVNAWQPAFESLGFIGAIKAVLPGDADWPEDYRIGDLRYNSISVMISEATYALGPHVHDPRSGEILHSDIIFEYGFFNAVMRDFDIFSPVNPPEQGPQRTTHFARSDFADTNDIVKDRITSQRPLAKSLQTSPGQHFQCGFAHASAHEIDRFKIGTLLLAGNSDKYVPESIVADHFTDVVMHEVGHTLGLRHNFAASTSYTREQLNDPAFVKEHGVTSSVMDYTPANIYSDLASADVASHGFYSTVVGSYDHAAIAYGYSIVSDEIPGEKSAGLSALARAAPMFLTDESADMMLNPYSQRYDLSADPIDYAEDHLAFVEQSRNSTWILDKIPDDAPASVLWRRESYLLKTVNSSIAIVSPMLGGANVTHAHHKAGEAPYQAPYLPRETQLRALNVLARVIQSDGDNSALFPPPRSYPQFIQEDGYEDCKQPSLDFSCLGRGLVDFDAVVLEIRKGAVLAALFPALDRIVAQDDASPLAIADVLLSIETAAMGSDQLKPRNQALLSYFHDLLQALEDAPGTDPRIKSAITAMYPQLTPAPVVRNKSLRRSG